MATKLRWEELEASRAGDPPRFHSQRLMLRERSGLIQILPQSGTSPLTYEVRFWPSEGRYSFITAFHDLNSSRRAAQEWATRHGTAAPLNARPKAKTAGDITLGRAKR